jgi:hypothetical protein
VAAHVYAADQSPLRSIEDLEEAQTQRCVALQAQPELALYYPLSLVATAPLPVTRARVEAV